MALNLSDFDVAREIAGNARVTNGNEESCTWKHRNFKAKVSLLKSFVMPSQLNLMPSRYVSYTQNVF